MGFSIDERASETPLVQTIWRTHSEQAGTFTSVAVSRWEIVVTQMHGETTIGVRGPETRATRAAIPERAEFFGISFEHGTFLPELPPEALLNGGVELPRSDANAFWLAGRSWQIPTFDNADSFVRQLVRAGVLVCDPEVKKAVEGSSAALSSRSLRRRCLKATGLTPGVVRQIERARHALALLQQGESILDTVELAGYFDQPHLTRSLQRFVGHTPAAIRRAGESVAMSVSYKTREFSGR